MLPRRLFALLGLLLACVTYVAADGCYDCCNGGTCGDAFDGSPGQCCGQIRNTVYCCPQSTVCAQTAEDAVCASRTSENVETYAYSYTPSAGGGIAGFVIALIVIGGVCCCLAAAGLAYRRRKQMRERGGGEFAGPPPMGAGGYDRRFSEGGSGPMPPFGAPFAPSYPQQAQPQQPGYGAAQPVMAGPPPGGYQGAYDPPYAGQPNRFGHGAPPPPAYAPPAY